ncbi:hypothetical protein [Saccharibacillus alkalitolerans]|uniref:DUF5590 domain-containing protein n=1 Tax=Saccharibacillus alkalitolerans TaxID=2705290 RepID=A0ABX0F519_9BACL|nr:hypothetical protein [Saccharibacillus alkalitolerans]NGZ74703.1 hypothetical protein [Saccharibacillus alkalitolerans]
MELRLLRRSDPDEKKYLIGFFGAALITLLLILIFSPGNKSKTEDLSAELQKNLNEYEVAQGITILQRTVVTENEPYILVVYKNSDSSKFGVMEWRKNGLSKETAFLGDPAELIRLDGQYGTYIGALLTKQPNAKSISILDVNDQLIEKYDLLDDRIFFYSVPEDLKSDVGFIQMQNKNGNVIREFKYDDI